MKLLEEAKIAGLKEKKYVSEEDAQTRIVAYTSWETDMLGGKRIDTREQAAPLLYMMQKAVPSSTISEFFVDTLETRRTDKRKEWKNLVEYCKTNKVDYIIIPSFNSYSRNISEVMEMTRELKRIGAPKVFFVLECASSNADDFEMMLTFEATIRAEEDRKQQKKKKLLADIKEGEEVMRQDDDYRDFFIFKFTSEMLEMERREKSIQRKKKKEAIPEDVREGAKQLRKWDKIARQKSKMSQRQK